MLPVVPGEYVGREEETPNSGDLFQPQPYLLGNLEIRSGMT
jgi:hypothetical protein